MRRWIAAVGLGMVAIAAVAVGAAGSSPAVILATPGGAGGAIERFTLRFSEPMVPLSGGPAPLAMECAVGGEGRWVDPATFVWSFAGALPGGTACKATLRDGLKSAAGDAVTGTTAFPIDAGGPRPRAVLPATDDEIEEDQTFLVAANGRVDRASVAAGAYCAVNGIGERIPVDLLPAATAGRVLGEPRLTAWRYGFLRDAGLPDPLPAQAGLRATALRDVVALRCRRPLPPGRDVALVWGRTIRSPGGMMAGADQRFDFTVRDAFTARLSCSRVNAAAGCSPVEPVTVSFSARVPRQAALAVRLEAGGKALVPTAEGNGPVTELKFAAPLPALTTARLAMPANLRDESGRPLSNARRFPLPVAIAAPPPLVKFAAPFGILEASEGGVLPVSVRAVEPRLSQGAKSVSGGIARIAGSDAEVARWVQRVAKAQENDYRAEKRGREEVTVNHTGTTSLLAGVTGVARTQLALPGKGRQFELVGVPLARPGFYVVELASPILGRALLGRAATRYVSAAALVTDMTVHFKWGRGASLVWVTSLQSGKPLTGAAVQVSDACSGKLLASGTTDAMGRLALRGTLPEPSSASKCGSGSEESPPLIVSARKSGDYSFTMSSWGDGIRPWDFELPYGWGRPDPIFHTITDRALVRVGETVNMKHVLRMPVLAGFRSGGAMRATLILSHSGSDTQFAQPLSLGADGIGESRWTPPAGAPNGTYRMEVRRADGSVLRSDTTIDVDEYRLPTMRASVSGPRVPAVRPKRIAVDLFAGYLSGGGASNAPVRLRAAYQRMTDAPAGWDEYSFGGEAPREGTVAMNDTGDDVGVAPLPDASTVPLTLGTSGALRTALTIPALADGANLALEMDYQDANGETLTASTRVPLYPAAIRLGIRTDGWLQRDSDLRLKVVALGLDGKPLAGRRVRVDLYTREILSARRRLIGGFYAYDNSARTTRIDADCSEKTDQGGVARCTIDAGVSGEVIAVATADDGQGNTARAVTSTWLAGADEWWFGGDNGDRMDVQPDARTYRIGDTAHVQVRMPFRSATALVTVEREGVLSSFVTTLSGRDPTVAVPLTGAYGPNVYISVLAVRGRIAGWRLWLADFARRWHLPFFSREGASPTALVDLAKPSYRLGIAKVAVGWEAHKLDVAVRAARNRYRVRDAAQVTVQVRGPGGRVPQQAEVAFVAVDEALLQLAPNPSWDLLSTMMGERPLAVLTSTGQMQVVGKRHYGRKAVANGGGGGGDLSQLARSDFRPVLLWRGRVPLDARGRARVTVPLADALSSYRLVAIATAGPQLFGTGSTTIRTVQDLSIFAGLPPLVRSGDRFMGVYTLRNGTDRPMRVEARVALTPAVARGAPLIVTIPPGGAMPVWWRLTAPAGIDRLAWTVSARQLDGPAVDRVTVEQRVIPAVPETTWAATLLRVGASPAIPIGSPAGALPGRGGVEIAFGASPLSGLEGARAYLRNYAFNCFEQRLSRAVVLGDRAAWDRQMAELPAYVAPDGLLRYFPDAGMTGSAVLTAYAVSITAEAGLEWPAQAKAQLLAALGRVVDGRIAESGVAPGDRRLIRLAAAAALARAGAATPATIAQVAIAPADMPTGTLAAWLQTLDRVPAADPALRPAAEAELRRRIVYEGARLDLTDAGRASWWMMESADEAAIKALAAVTGRPGWAADAPRMAVGVALRRRGGHWDTTPANAWATVTAARFANAYPAAVGGLTRVQLGDRVAESTGATVRLPLPARPVPLQLSQAQGAGPWATVSVRAAVPLSAPRFAGYRIARQAEMVQRRVPGRISRGDVMKVRLTVDAPVDRTWVVIEDPIPAGATVIGNRANQSATLAASSTGSPSYVERGLDAWRGFYGWMPRGQTIVEYSVRINAAGNFQLPPTRVEAMYSPEISAALPNRPLAVTP